MKYIIKRQEAISDCGACCLYSIIRYYKGFVPLEIIKIDTQTNNNGTTFYNLKEAAIKYGFEVKGIKNSINQKHLPCIAQLKLENELYHFVVVYEIHADEYVCMDPSIGIKKFERSEFEKLFTKNILLFKPTSNIIRYKINKHFINLIKKIYINNIKASVAVIMLSIFVIGFSLISTYFIKIIINNYVGKYIFFLILLFVIKNIFIYFKNIYTAKLNKNYSYNLIYDYFSYYFFLPFKYLQLKSIGDITSRINDLKTLKEFLSKEIVNIFVSLLIIITILLIFFIINPLLSIYIIILTIIYFFVVLLISKKSYYLYNNILDSESNFDNKSIEYLSKIITIKNMVKERYFLKKISDLIFVNSNHYYKLEKHLNNISTIMNIYNDLSLVLLIVICLFNKDSIDNILIYVLYFNYYLENINYIVSLLPNLEYFKSLFNKINGIYYLDKEKQNNGFKIDNNSIIISNLKYNNNLNNILNNIDLKFNKNDKVLLIGENGCGKSTLLNCINNNIKEYEGLINIDNINIKNIDSKSLKESICLTMQNDNIFNDTIKNNIILDKDYDKEKFETICNITNLDEIIKKKGGINSNIKDNVSGGEKQIIILARALYQDRKILLFDESLSEIEFKLRKKIINNINNYYKSKTIIYVSHYYEKCKFNQIIDLTARKEDGN